MISHHLISNHAVYVVYQGLVLYSTIIKYNLSILFCTKARPGSTGPTPFRPGFPNENPSPNFSGLYRQSLLDELYPGSKLRIQQPQGPDNGSTDEEEENGGKFEDLPYETQMEIVLREHQKLMPNADLFAELTKRGSKIPKETLMSYLSRNKNGKFYSPERGQWTLQELKSQ